MPKKPLCSAKSDYQYKIEYEYDFRISNQLRFQNHRCSLFLTCRKQGSLLSIQTSSIVKRFEKSYSLQVLNLVLVPMKVPIVCFQPLGLLNTDFPLFSDSLNFHASMNGKAVKIPMEHDEWVFKQDETESLGNISDNQVSMSTPTNGPSDTGTTQEKTGGSNQNGGGGEKVSSGGSPVSVVCQSKKGGRPSSGSSSGSGGDDGGDDRKPNIPAGGCQGSSQCDVDDKEEGGERVKQEEQMHAADDDDDDNNHNDDGEQENEKGSLPEQTGL